MRPILSLFAAAAVLSPGSASAQADAKALATALGDCYVAQSTGEERIKLARWITVSMLSSAKVQTVAQIAPGARERANRDMAEIFTRLTVKACLPQSKALFSADPSGKTFELAGEALGRMAMTELLSDPDTEASFGDYTKYLDDKMFDQLKPAK